MSNKSIVCLHLSDLHFCESMAGWDLHRVLDTLLTDLQEMESNHGLLPQVIFFTGDLAFGNYGSGPGSTLTEQYQGVENFLTKIRQAFSIEVPKANLFLVPGNHDVDRNEATDALTHWIEQEKSAESITQQIQSSNKQWKQFMERLAIYRDFLQNHDYTHLLNDPERLIYSEVREINGLKLGIGGFNSAWNCGRDKEKGKLWLGGDWQNGTIVQGLKSKNADLKLALIHHPPGWFVEQEDAKIRSQMERDFDFFLHGHEHQGWVNAGAEGHIRIAAAACYERADQENGYNFVRLNLESGEVEIWLRKYDDHGGGWIPRVIKNKTTNDGLWKVNLSPGLVAKINKAFLPYLVSLDKVSQIPKNPIIPDSKTPGTFALKVRGEIKRIFSFDRPAISALRLILRNDNKFATPEELLVPDSLDPQDAIRIWRKTVKNCLQSHRDIIKEIKLCANEVLGWLVLLVIQESEILNHSRNSLDFFNASEIIVPVETPAGSGIFVSRLFEKPARLKLNGNKVYCTGWIDFGQIETGLLPQDRLLEIERMIYKEVFFEEPSVHGKWLDELKNTLRLRFEDDMQMYYFTFPRTQNVEDYQVIGQLKNDLPHLKAIIIGADDNSGNSIIVMDESLLVPLLREFLLMMEQFS